MATTKRFICIHGHFYQPPRENPWLETVETQDSAAPYHDWNERVCAECYATNGAARSVNGKNQIIRIENGQKREMKVKVTDKVRPEDTIIVPQRYF